MSTFTCTECGKSGFPSMELDARGKLHPRCVNPECGHVETSMTPADFNVSTEAKPAPAKQSALWEQSLAPRTISQPPPPPPVARPANYDPGDVIGMIRARRDFLETRVAELEAAKCELRKLNKMLTVANRADAAERLASPQLTLPREH